MADRAGQDAALIARHFGGKLGLYLAMLTPVSNEGPGKDLLDPARMSEMLGRVYESGPGPLFRAAVTSRPDVAVQAPAQAALYDRVVAPLTARYTAAGVDRPELHAGIAVAAFVGIALGRASAAFDELTAVDVKDLVVAVRRLLAPPDEGVEPS